MACRNYSPEVRKKSGDRRSERFNFMRRNSISWGQFANYPSEREVAFGARRALIFALCGDHLDMGRQTNHKGAVGARRALIC